MTTNRLTDIEDRLDAATPGAWQLLGGGEWISPLGIDVGSEDESCHAISPANADLIVNAPDDLRRCVQVLRAIDRLVAADCATTTTVRSALKGLD